jgi:hypothetical protein
MHTSTLTLGNVLLHCRVGYIITTGIAPTAASAVLRPSPAWG